MRCVFFVLALLPSVVVVAEISTLKERVNHNNSLCKISVEISELNELSPGWKGTGEPDLTVGKVSLIANEWVKSSSLTEEQVFPIQFSFNSYRDIGMLANIWLYEVKFVSFGKSKPPKPVYHYIIVLPNGKVLTEVCANAS